MVTFSSAFAPHQRGQRVGGRDLVAQQGPHVLGDRHVYALALSQGERRLRGVHPLCDLAELLEDVFLGAALARAPAPPDGFATRCRCR